VIAELIHASEQGQYLYASREFRDGALGPDDVLAARESVEAQPDHTRYHVLMALRRDQPNVYAEIAPDVRAQVLAGALEHLTFLNDFGYLAPDGSHDGESAEALLETGDAGREPLLPVLANTTPAPSRGSEAATIAKVYGVRRCDYAYRYLALLTGAEDPAFARDPGERDVRIAQLQSRLA
jgi:hypothetical protein